MHERGGSVPLKARLLGKHECGKLVSELRVWNANVLVFIVGYILSHRLIS